MNIKELRSKYGYTQKQLAELLDVSTKTVESWEQGRYKPGRRSKNDLNRAFPNEYEEAAILHDNTVFDEIDKLEEDDG